MGFIFQERPPMAIAPDTGETVKRGGDFFDAGGRMLPYTYTDGDLKFVLSVTPVKRRVTIQTEKGAETEFRFVGSLIDQNILYQVLSLALSRLGRPSLTKDEYKHLLQRVRDGLSVCTTAGGKFWTGHVFEYFSGPEELAAIKARLEKA